MAFRADSGSEFDIRDGERRLPFDPASGPFDAGICFIGHVRSPWMRREDCPKNMAAAREKGGGASIHVDPDFRDGLAGLADYSHLILLSWFDRAPRNLIVQKPRHAAVAKGVFALRSPVRPNPVGVHVVRLLDLDQAIGRLDIEAIDLLDGTPIVDIKPYFASTDSIPDASRPAKG